MKKVFTYSLAMLIITLSHLLIVTSALAQPPQKMSYQAVIRNASNQLVTSHSVGLRVSILQGSATGTAVYVETQTATTNANGLVTIEIGGGSPVTGTFSGIDWSTGIYFIKTETDPAGGTSYTIAGTSQILSVPYALYAKTSADAASKSYVEELEQRLTDMEDLVTSQLLPPEKGLIAYYPLNGNAEDHSGNGNNGTILNAIQSGDRFGDPNGCYRFDGNSGTERYISSHIGRHATLSFSVWFKSGIPTTLYPNILNFGSNNRLDRTMLGNHTSYIQANKMGTISSGAVVGGTYTSFLNSSLKFNDDTWHHAVVMFVENDKMYLYLDNSFVGESAFTPNNPSDDLLYIGRQINDNAGSVLHESHFNGSIDDIRIYDRALSKAEIDILYNENGYKKNILSDSDGNIYNTVKIGTQVWMAENLKTTKYSDGTTIPNVTVNATWETLTTPAYCWYNNDIANKQGYGALYNWYTIDASTNGNKKVCPTGWHVPSDDEWKTMESYLGMNQTELNNTEWRGTTEGGKLKATGVSHWTSPNTGATNETGFNALPAGARTNDFYNLGNYANFWTTTLYDANLALWRGLRYDGSTIRRVGYSKLAGLSIRCIKD
jgi:uncharacterized protein (TIGR02145 family)